VLSVSPLPKTLLDAGCGDGLFTRELSAFLPEAHITALDRSYPKYLTGLTPQTRATQSTQATQQTRITFVTGSVDTLPFDEDSFDVVVASLSLHHWEKKAKGIAEVYRVLKKGGTLVIGDPLLQGWMSNRVLGRLTQKIDGGVFTTPKELTTYLDNVGFKAVRISLVPYTLASLFLITASKPQQA